MIAEALRTCYVELVNNVDINRDSFFEIMYGAMNGDERFGYQLTGSKERMRYVLACADNPQVWKALRLGLLLCGYTEELKAVNRVLPPYERAEDPASWFLPLTSIRGYLMSTVNLHRLDLAERMSRVMSWDVGARKMLKAQNLPCNELLEIVLDRLDRPEVLEEFRLALKVCDYYDVDAAIGRALTTEAFYLKHRQHLFKDTAR